MACDVLDLLHEGQSYRRACQLVLTVLLVEYGAKHLLHLLTSASSAVLKVPLGHFRHWPLAKYWPAGHVASAAAAICSLMAAFHACALSAAVTCLSRVMLGSDASVAGRGAPGTAAVCA